MFKTQYYKNHLFFTFSRQKSSLPWQPTKILSGSSSYFDEYLKGYLCVKFGAFAKKLTIFSQIRWTIKVKELNKTNRSARKRAEDFGGGKPQVPKYMYMYMYIFLILNEYNCLILNAHMITAQNMYCFS